MKFHKSIVQTTCPSPLGAIALAATSKGLAGLWFIDGQRYLPEEVAGLAQWPADPDHPVLKQASRQLAEYFAGRRKHFDVPLDLDGGTAFQQSVWQALLAIPPGGTASYGEVSRRIGKPLAMRAVGAAVGAGVAVVPEHAPKTIAAPASRPNRRLCIQDPPRSKCQ